MQLSNDTSKDSTSPPYLVKNERSPISIRSLSTGPNCSERSKPDKAITG